MSRRLYLRSVTLTAARRLKRTVNGNAHWELTLTSSDGTVHILRTLRDGALGAYFSDRLVGSTVDAFTDGRGALTSVEASR